MRIGVFSHYGRNSYWDFYADDAELRKLSDTMGEILDENLKKPRQSCFYFDGEKQLAVYGRLFAPGEVQNDLADDRGIGAFHAFFHLEKEESDWLLEDPSRLLQFQEWIATNMVYYGKEHLEQTQGVFRLPQEQIRKINIGPLQLDEGDWELIHQMEMAVLEYWKNIADKKGGKRRRFYYEKKGGNYKIALPLLMALDRLPCKLRQFPFWMSVCINRSDSDAVNQLGLLNGVCSTLSRSNLLGVTALPMEQGDFDKTTREIYSLLEWLRKAENGAGSLKAAEQKTASPWELVQLLRAAVQLKSMLAAPGKKNAKEILSLLQQNEQAEYFLSKKEAKNLDAIKAVRLEIRNEEGQQLHWEDSREVQAKTKERSVFGAHKLQILVAAVMLLSAWWINAKIVPGEQGLLLQINLSPVSLLSQIMLFFAGGLFFTGIKNQR